MLDLSISVWDQYARTEGSSSWCLRSALDLKLGAAGQTSVAVLAWKNHANVHQLELVELIDEKDAIPVPLKLELKQSHLERARSSCRASWRVRTWFWWEE